MKSIIMPRGDLRPVRVTVRTPDTQQPVTDLDEVYFSVKATYSDVPCLIHKRMSAGDIENLGDGSYQFSILPEDTDNLKVGKYLYDVELVRIADLKQTFTGELVLTNEVTFAENEG